MQPRSTIVRLLLRRWYIAALGLAFTAALAFAALTLVPPTYSASARTVVLPPTTATGQNPYLDLGGMQPLTDVLAITASNSATVDSVIAQGLHGSYTVVGDPTTSGPVLLVTGKSRTPAEALAITKAVSARLDPLLQQLQSSENIPTRYWAVTKPISSADTVSKARKSQSRALIAAVAVGVLCTILLTAGLDKILLRYSARRSGKPTARREETPENTTEPTQPSPPTPAVRGRPGRRGRIRVGAAGVNNRRVSAAGDPT